MVSVARFVLTSQLLIVTTEQQLALDLVPAWAAHSTFKEQM